MYKRQVELSSDATVHAFGIDTVYGKHYKFTIDQLRRKIYNQDSLPIGADTIIDRILIDTFTVSGWITSREDVYKRQVQGCGIDASCPLV